MPPHDLHILVREVSRRPHAKATKHFCSPGQPTEPSLRPGFCSGRRPPASRSRGPAIASPGESVRSPSAGPGARSSSVAQVLNHPANRCQEAVGELPGQPKRCRSLLVRSGLLADRADGGVGRDVDVSAAGAGWVRDRREPITRSLSDSSQRSLPPPVSNARTVPSFPPTTIICSRLGLRRRTTGGDNSASGARHLQRTFPLNSSDQSCPSQARGCPARLSADRSSRHRCRRCCGDR